ncbi:hypothetical protein AKJ16_DCAP25782 [Drosera capensis]
MDSKMDIPGVLLFLQGEVNPAGDIICRKCNDCHLYAVDAAGVFSVLLFPTPTTVFVTTLGSLTVSVEDNSTPRNAIVIVMLDEEYHDNVLGFSFKALLRAPLKSQEESCDHVEIQKTEEAW